MSPNGVWVAGHLPAASQSWHWKPVSGGFFTHFEKVPGYPLDNPARISNDGPGKMSSALISLEGYIVGALWSPFGIIAFTGFGSTSPYVSQVRGLSADGLTIAGSSPIGSGWQSFRWDSAGTTVVLAPQPGSLFNHAYAVSGDGALVVGVESDGSVQRAVAWSASGAATFLPQGAAQDARAYGVNHDGGVVVGSVDGRAARWTSAGGVHVLSALPNSVALATSDDGETVVGATNGNTLTGHVAQIPPLDEMLADWTASIWRPGMGWRPLDAVLDALGVAVPASFEALNHASALSADGRRIAGTGTGGAFVVDLPRWVETYCTAQTNSQGCTPHVATQGTASATSGAGFHVTAGDLIPGVVGLLLYGTSGASSQPLLGGTLCVAAPRRTAAQDTGGIAPCEGSLGLDFNAFVTTGGDPTLAAGVQVWAQYWSRDPFLPPPLDSNLTDAVSFRLMP